MVPMFFVSNLADASDYIVSTLKALSVDLWGAPTDRN